MENFDIYELNIQIWHEDDEWLYSVHQEFDEEQVELLFYGTSETLPLASQAVGEFISTLTFA